jgi:hypothetical protein
VGGVKDVDQRLASNPLDEVFCQMLHRPCTLLLADVALGLMYRTGSRPACDATSRRHFKARPQIAIEIVLAVVMLYPAFMFW